VLKKYFILFIFILSFVLFLYVFYRSEIIFNGDRRNFYLAYYIISLIGFITGFVLIFLNNNIFKYLSITIISLIFSFYIFEFYMTYVSITMLKDLNIKKKIKIYKKNTGKDYDIRDIYSYYLDQKKNNPNIRIDSTSANLLKYNELELFPLSGVSNSEVILCNENGYYKHIFTDRYGFNNVDEIWDYKEQEYVLFGDSFAEGYCEDKEHTLVNNLQKLLQKKVLNLGQGGAGSLLEYATIREYLPIKTNNLIMLLSDNDIIDLRKELKNSVLIKYLKDKNFTQNLLLNQKKIDTIYKTIFENEEKYRKKIEFIRFIKLNYVRSYLSNLLSKKQKINKVSQSNVDSEGYLEFKEIMLELKNLSLKREFNFFVIYLPSYNYFKGNSYYNKDHYPIINILKDYEINYLDLTKEVFSNEKDPYDLFPFGFYGHYNKNGSKKISEAIYRFILR